MVAYEYAKALFDLATEEKKIELFYDHLGVVLGSFKEEPDFKKLIVSPLIDQETKKQIIAKVYHSLDQLFLDFMNVLIDQKRVNILGLIKEEYQQLLSEYKNTLEVEVISAEKLTQEKISHILDQLKNKYPQKNIKIQNTVNSAMLYGIQILCNGESLDLSLKNRLKLMKDSL